MGRSIAPRAPGVFSLRLAALALTIVGLGVLVVPAAAQQTSPYTTVDVVFGSGVLQNTLPFDVPFLMTGAIDRAVQSVTIRYVRLRGSDAKAAERAPARCDDVAANDWIAAGRWGRVIADTANFTILVPRLDVNEFYCFRFELQRKLTQAEREALVAFARTTIDQDLRTVPRQSLPRAEVLEIRRKLLERLKTLPTTEVVVVPIPNSVWDPKLPDNRALASFLPFLQPVLNAQNQMRDALDRYGRRGRAVEAVVTTWATSAEIRGVTSAVVAGAAGNTAIASLLNARGDVVNAVAAGTFQLGVDLTLAEAWTPEELDSHVRAAEAAAERLGQLQQTIAEIGGPLSAAVTVDRNALATVAAQVATAQTNAAVMLNDIREAQRAVARRLEAVAAAGEQVGTSAEQQIDMTGTTRGAFTTRHAWYIGLDLGFAVAPTIESVSPYLGTNIYFRPVNKEAPLSSFGFQEGFMRRFSAMVGVTSSGRFNKTNQRKALFGDQAVLAGAGLRVTDSFRVAGGFIFLTALDANPNIDHETLEMTPFFAVSIDWDVKGTFTNRPQQ